MPIINRIAGLSDEIAAWRRDFHENPELQYDVHRTAGIVAAQLRAFGCDEVVTGIGRTGVVGVIRGRAAGDAVIGLRADMDALPIHETTDVPYKSKVAGKMHACGHDGHTAMLLGGAKYLAETRNFAGTAIVVFQPAEEGGSGAKAMVDDGLMERFGIQEIYGMHNMPGLPVGHFAIRPGPIMASIDRFEIHVEGRGGHGAMPHLTVDPMLVAFHIGTAAQSIVSRTLNPLDAAVVSITSVHGGEAFNVIPDTVEMVGTARAFDAGVRDTIERRLGEIASGTAAMFGARGRLDYQRGDPVTVNHRAQTDFAVAVARDIAGEAAVDDDTPPLTGSEDFSHMLEARPGAYIFIGNGDTKPVHNAGYDFNDQASPAGASFWARLVEKRMPA